MRFYLRLTMEGDFPGSPDSYRSEISEQDYDELMTRFIVEGVGHE
ncbi:MAG: hypothetical protein WDA41_09385 [Candidatus Neomarinimicrobiota bacterium]|jgi:hypothetical protein